ncbi:helicase associated domain-containing protein [Curtobacterium sp. PhB115]|uniref:helicase associated domain-containing protein n=1 Tax=Curtobacterium sp. PhB115 TaxID=2485173 RepID=UPI000F4C2CF3|nr:helicase associated protein [Curtobacterium sp. PhB115]
MVVLGFISWGGADSDPARGSDQQRLDRARPSSSKVAGVAALTVHRVQHGDVAVLNAYTTSDGFPLGRRVNSRRVECRQHTLRHDRVQQLNELGMIWRMRLPPEDGSRRRREAAHFTAMLRRIVVWTDEHDGWPPSAPQHDGDCAGIGRRLVRQRQLFRSQRLDADRQQVRLEEIES